MNISQKQLQVITITLLISVVFVLIGWDIFDKVADPTGDTTISWQIWTASCSRPIIAFGAGVVAGHLWWQTP
jgi:hypothetical protein